jgi:transcriptional regulator with XRE-family HTH domain
MPASVSEEYRRAIGSAIKQARKEQGMSQQALGIAVGSSKNAVSNWERGVSAPTAESLRDTCRALDVPPQRLLAMNGATPTADGPSHRATAAELAGQLAQLRKDAHKAIPDLMQALQNAEQTARRLAGDGR